MGVHVQEIYFTLVAEEEGATFIATMKVLDDDFVPKANVPFERHLFSHISQVWSFDNGRRAVILATRM